MNAPSISTRRIRRRVAYLAAFGLPGALARPRPFANGNEAIVALFRRGVGFGTLTQDIVRPYLDAGQLIALNGTMEDPLALVRYPRPEMPAYFAAIVAALSRRKSPG